LNLSFLISIAWWDQNLDSPNSKNIDVIDQNVKVEILLISQVWNKLTVEEMDSIHKKIPQFKQFMSNQNYKKVIHGSE
jgi:hypothetical protein